MERQLLFLLDYDLRMEEPELLAHFHPFLRRSASAPAPTYALAPVPTPVSRVELVQYPTTPKRLAPAPSGLLTPSPSPVSRGAQPRSSSEQRVSPSSLSSGSSHSEQSSSSPDTDDERYTRNTRRPHPTQSSEKYAGTIPTSTTLRRSASSKGPLFAAAAGVDDPSSSGYPTPSESARSQPLRTQRSGSLRQLYDAGKEIFAGNGHRARGN